MPRTTVGLGSLYVYLVETADPDGDPLELILDTAPVGMQIDAATRLITWTPGPDQLGANLVSLRVDDGRGGFATQDFVIDVLQQTENGTPTIISTPSFFATIDTQYQYEALAVDPENDPVIWSLASAPDGLSIDALSGSVRWTPTASQIGFHEVIIEATDIQGATAIQGFGINVGSSNVPVVVNSAPVTVAFADEPYFYPVRAFDANGDRLSFSLTDAPTGMTIGDATGLIQWTPTVADTGTHTVAIQVDDGKGGVGGQSFTLSVVGDGPNQPPTITSSPVKWSRKGSEFCLHCTN